MRMACFALVAGLLLTTPRQLVADVPPTFTVHWFGEDVTVAGINDYGQMVGWNSTFSHAILILPNGNDFTFVNVGYGCNPTAISNTGMIVGQWHRPGSTLWTDAFIIVPEDTNADGTPDVWYRDANTDGVNDLLHDLGCDNNAHLQVMAEDVNDAGMVVGHAQRWVDEVYWVEDSYIIDPLDTNADGKPDQWFQDSNQDGLNDLMESLAPLYTGDSAIARKINSHGIVTGYSWNNWNLSELLDERAVIWQGAAAPQDLGVLYPPPTTDSLYTSEAQSINSQDQVVGQSHVPWSVNPQRGVDALLWSDYQGLLDLSVQDASQYLFWDQVFTSGRDISASGWVVGQASLFAQGYGELGSFAYLLIPADVDSDGQPDTWYSNASADPPLMGPNDLMIDLNEVISSGFLEWASRVNRRGQIVAYGLLSGEFRYCLLTPITLLDSPPDRPAQPTGPVQGIVGKTYTYDASTTDFEPGRSNNRISLMAG